VCRRYRHLPAGRDVRDVQRQVRRRRYGPTMEA